MIDGLLANLLYPLFLTYQYVIAFIAIFFFASFPAVVRILLKGTKSITVYTELFAFLSKIPLGKTVFMVIVNLFAPYTGSIGAVVDELTVEKCKVSMKDRPWLRNPFKCVHAVAMVNLGEMASGIAFISFMQHYKGIKGIPQRIETQFLKKARGPLTTTAVIPIELIKEKADTEEFEMAIKCEVMNRKREVVSVVTVYWNIKNKNTK